MSINTNEYTRHLHPGKFEGEQSGATEYFYEQSLNGDGELIENSAYSEDDDEYWEQGNSGELFQIDSEEAEAFGLTTGHWFLLREDSQGFCYGSEHKTRMEAEIKFKDWVG